jgi:hypothetical protein
VVFMMETSKPTQEIYREAPAARLILLRSARAAFDMLYGSFQTTR